MSDLTRNDVIEMLQGIFKEQRELTDDEMQAYKDMLRRKENDMAFIKATESGFNQTMRKDQATLIAELISRVTSLEETVEFILEQLHMNTIENTDDKQSKEAIKEVVKDYIKATYGSIDNL